MQVPGWMQSTIDALEWAVTIALQGAAPPRR
jgi:hypothetical protein